MAKELCFGVKDNTNTNETELKDMLGDDCEIIMLEPDSTMADVLVIAGVYESKTRARKDGWNQPIPKGFYDKEVGKLRTRISIWNPSTPITQ